MKTQKSADIASDLFLAFFGLVVSTPPQEQRRHGGTPAAPYPSLIPGTDRAAGGWLLLAIRSWRYRGADPDINWPDGKVPSGSLVTFVSLIILHVPDKSPGHAPCYRHVVAFSSGTSWRGRHAVIYALLTGVISGVVVFYLFIQFLELNFPAGFLAP